LEKCKSRSEEREIELVRKKIKKNEANIKCLEEKIRSKLDHKLAVLLQLQESHQNLAERIKINEKIRKIKIKIAQNEKEIKNFKSERSKLDHELAAFLQLQEVTLSYL
jgi:predicted RNase H-like nuclease (RuvC/YqgF family)